MFIKNKKCKQDAIDYLPFFHHNDVYKNAEAWIPPKFKNIVFIYSYIFFMVQWEKPWSWEIEIGINEIIVIYKLPFLGKAFEIDKDNYQ